MERERTTGKAAAAATVATLIIIPCVFVLTHRGATTASVSLDPDDANSRYYDS